MENEATMNIVQRAIPRLVDRALEPNLNSGRGLIWYRWKMANERLYTLHAATGILKKIHKRAGHMSLQRHCFPVSSLEIQETQ